MFTVRKFNNSIVINTLNTNRINLFNIHQLRKQFILALQMPCDNIILDLEQIGFIDSASFEVIDEMVRIAHQHHLSFSFMNLTNDLTEIIELLPNEKEYNIVPDISFSKKKDSILAS